MKGKIFLMGAALLGLVTFAACSDDDNDVKDSTVPAAVSASFKTQFPNAVNPQWEKNGQYYVADFTLTQVEKDAWFTDNGTLVMTVSDYGKNLFYLPGTVEGAFAQDDYGTCTVDDVKYYERTSASSFYLIEVEKEGMQDTDVFYDTDGALIIAVPEGSINVTPDTVF